MSTDVSDREHCYRHKTRETGVHCSSCGNPICTDCMTPTPVGMRCPACSRQRTKVRTARSFDRTGALPLVTQAIIGICVLAWIGEILTENGDDRLLARGALFGPEVAVGHEWWRIVTAGFLHADQMPMAIFHLGMNMYLLAWLGREFEPRLGPVRFAVAYLACVIGGSVGALLLSPDAFTVGASGAVFGLMGFGLLEIRDRGIPLLQTQLGGTLVLNLILTFAFVDYISVGGHLGGLATGYALAWLMIELPRRQRLPRHVVTGVCVGVAAGLFVAAVLVADTTI